MSDPAEELPDWPLYGWADDVRAAMAACVAAAEPFALVTLIATQGGAPRPPGAQMLIASSRLSGFLSGGCVEGDVAAHARRALQTGEPVRLVYGDGSPYPDIRLLCGSRIELLVEPVPAGDPAPPALLAAERERRPATWSTDGRRREVTAEAGEELWLDLAMFHVKRRYDPPPRLVVVGGDPTALAIAQLGAAAAFETWLVRPKGPAEAPGLTGVRYDRRSPAEALAGIGLDPWSFVAVATHDLEVDEAALATALPSPAPYVGVLGARRRIPERVARLRALGVEERALARLKAPIGLYLGGKAPWEIAVAVLAEIIAARHAVANADGRALG